MSTDEISSSKLLDLENRALDGDGEAAFKLRMYYSYGPRYDPDAAELWESIAIENGLAKAMYFRALKYMNSKDPKAQRRAKYWFDRLKNDPFYGQKSLNHLDEVPKE